MEDRSMENVERFNYIAKAHGKKKSEHPILRGILIAVLAIIIPLKIILVIIEGWSELFKSNLIAMLLIISGYIKMKPIETYISAPVIVEFYPSEFVIFYESIDREDKKGRISEKIIFKYSNIKSLRYSDSLCNLVIEGMPLELIKSLKKSNGKEIINDYSEKGKLKEIQLYINEDYKDTILTKLKLYTGLSVEKYN